MLCTEKKQMKTLLKNSPECFDRLSINGDE
jgi:hypothetical protein